MPRPGAGRERRHCSQLNSQLNATGAGTCVPRSAAAYPKYPPALNGPPAQGPIAPIIAILTLSRPIISLPRMLRPSQRLRPLLRAPALWPTAHWSAAAAAPRVDIVWMFNGWQFLVPMMQKELDARPALLSRGCTIRVAEYCAAGRLDHASLAGADVLIPAMARVDDAALVAAGPGVRLVYQPAVDTSRIDTAACAARGIPVCHAPGANANALAETILMLMLAVARRLKEGIARAHAPPGGWGGPAGFELRGRTLGIVGASGHSGALLSQVCGPGGLGMRVLGTRSTSTRAEFEAMLSAADVVSVNCLLNDATRGLIGAPELALMKPGAVLVNCARGDIVDRAALEHALDSGHLGGAGLDVHWQEPCAPGDSLLLRDNVVATPHLGASTEQFFDAVSHQLADNVAAVLAGGSEAPGLRHRL